MPGVWGGGHDGLVIQLFVMSEEFLNDLQMIFRHDRVDFWGADGELSFRDKFLRDGE